MRQGEIARDDALISCSRRARLRCGDDVRRRLHRGGEHRGARRRAGNRGARLLGGHLAPAQEGQARARRRGVHPDPLHRRLRRRLRSPPISSGTVRTSRSSRAAAWTPSSCRRSRSPTSRRSRPPTEKQILVLGGDSTLGRDEFLRILYGAQVSLEVAVGRRYCDAARVAARGGCRLLPRLRRHCDLPRDRDHDGIPLSPLRHRARRDRRDRARQGDVRVPRPGRRHARDRVRAVQLVLLRARLPWSRSRCGRRSSSRLPGWSARATGVSSARTSSRIWSAPLIVFSTLSIAAFILAEAGLSFLGLGIKLPTASWGRCSHRRRILHGSSRADGLAGDRVASHDARLQPARRRPPRRVRPARLPLKTRHPPHLTISIVGLPTNNSASSVSGAGGNVIHGSARLREPMCSKGVQ